MMSNFTGSAAEMDSPRQLEVLKEKLHSLLGSKCTDAELLNAFLEKETVRIQIEGSHWDKQVRYPWEIQI